MIDGTLETIDGRPALRFERRLAHPVARVWRAVTEPDELAQWFVAPVAWTPALGETFEGEGQSGEIVALEAPTLLRWTWGDERYSFELAADGDGCRLVFTHVFDPSYGPAAQHAAGWETYLDRLEALLAGGALSEEEAHGSIAELHERYAARFGQDPAPGRRMIASFAFRDLTLESSGDDAARAAPRAPLPPSGRARVACDQRARRAGAVVSGRRADGDRGERSAAPAASRRGSATPCASSCDRTGRAACSSSRTSSPSATSPRAPRPAGIAASRASRRCSASSR